MSTKIIFVDFFDTVMLRYVHPFEVIYKFAKRVVYKFGLEISAKEFVKMRYKTIASLSKNGNDPTYYDIMSKLYCDVISRGGGVPC